MQTATTKHRQGGNALFLILIAVVLFAALTYAITQSSGGGSRPDRETASLSASNIIQYGQALQNGFSNLVMHGVAVDAIETLPPLDVQFDQDAHKPVNVFHPDGGNIPFQLVDPAWVGTLIPLATHDTGNWYFIGSKGVDGVGTAALERMALLKDVRENICATIDERISGNHAIPTVTQSEATLLASGGSLDDGSGTLSGRLFYCVKPSDTAHYFYYHVLAER